MNDYTKRIVEVGFTDPGTGEIKRKGEYRCILPCVPGDLCRVHDENEGYRLGRILQVSEEDRDSCLAEGMDRKKLNDVFEVIPGRNGISGESYSIYPKPEQRRKSAAARISAGRKTGRGGMNDG